MSTTTFVSAVPVLASLDIERSVAFYEQKLGFQRGAVFPNYAVLRRDAIELHLWKCDERHIAENTSCRVNVQGIDALYAELKGIAHPKAPLTDQPWGLREFGIIDLDGNLIKFAERRAT
jgi:catechol 2,3-dioxygenase-like lactoylglutathione lyase family enzyme